STTSGTGIFRNSADTANLSSAPTLAGTIAAGGSTFVFKYRDSTVGTPTIAAADQPSGPDTGLTDATQAETVHANQSPAVPTLSSPDDNAATPDTTPAFSWAAATDPDGDTVTYDIQVDNDSDFSSPLSLSPTSTGLSGTSYTPTTTLTAGTTYFWRVRANDGTTPSPYSNWPGTLRVRRPRTTGA